MEKRYVLESEQVRLESEQKLNTLVAECSCVCTSMSTADSGAGS